MKEGNNFEYLKKYGVFVVLGAIGAIMIYYIFKPAGTDKPSYEEISNINTSIPEAEKKDLVNDKMEIYYSNEQHERKKDRAFNEDFHNNISTLTEGSFEEKEVYNKDQDTITERLNEMMEMMQKEKEKQHKPKYTNTSSSGKQTYTSTRSKGIDAYDMDMNAWEKESSGFFESTTDGKSSSKGKNNQTDVNIYAVIQGDQLVMHRQRVKLRLSKNATINGKTYKENTFVYAIANIQVNRLMLTVDNIAHDPVNLEAYDGADGNVGIYVETPNLVSQGGREVGDDVIDDVDASIIPFGNTIKGLFKKKQKEEKVTLLNNYKILLKS